METLGDGITIEYMTLAEAYRQAARERDHYLWLWANGHSRYIVPWPDTFLEQVELLSRTLEQRADYCNRLNEEIL